MDDYRKWLVQDLYDFAHTHWGGFVETHSGKLGERSQIIEVYRSFISKCKLLGIEHKGTSHPDWRVYSLPDLSAITSRERLPRKDWLPSSIDLSLLSQVFDQGNSVIQKDLVTSLSLLREVIEDHKAPLSSKIAALLRCKYLLILSSEKEHDLLMPIYLSLYPEVVRSPIVWNSLIRNDTYWPVVSSLHLFPRAVGVLDIETFSNDTDWFIINYSVIQKGLGNVL